MRKIGKRHHFSIERAHKHAPFFVSLSLSLRAELADFSVLPVLVFLSSDIYIYIYIYTREIER